MGNWHPVELSCVRGIFAALLVVSGSGCGYFDAAEDIKTERVIAKKLVIEDSVHVPAGSGGEGTVRFASQEVALAAFTEYVHPILEKNCGECHGSAVSPKFAETDPIPSFSTLISANVLNFKEPSSSRIVKRLTDQAHNCWNDCPKDGEILASAIQAFADNAQILDIAADPTIKFTSTAIALKDQITAPPGVNDDGPTYFYFEAEQGEATNDFAAKKSEGAFGYALSALEGSDAVLPESIEDKTALGKIDFKFSVEDQGTYHFFAKVRSSGLETDSFYVELDDDDAIGIWDVSTDEEGFSWVRVRFRTGSGGGGNFQRNLAIGPHTLTIYARGKAVELDAVIATRDQGMDLQAAQDMQPKSLEFDLSAAKPELGEGLAIIAVVQDLNEKSYLVTSVSVKSAGKPFRIKNVKPIINGYYLDQHATYTGVDEKVEGPFKLLSTAPLILLKDKGIGEDTLSFAVEVLDPL